MNVMIGIDPHKASHRAVAIGRDEDQIARVTVRAGCSLDCRRRPSGSDAALG
jgi:hypothetical protein